MKHFLCLALATTAIGCAGVTLNKEHFDKVKKVAIVGFTGEIDLSSPNDKNTKTGFGAIVNVSKGISEMANGEFKERRIAQGEKVYAMLSEKLGSTLGWAMIGKDALAANADYKKLLDANESGGLGSGYGLQYVPTVLREETARSLDDAARASLLKSLGADAIAVVRVKYVVGETGGFAMGGMGHTTKYPKAIVQLSLLDGTPADPTWKEPWAEGKPSKEGIENTMGVESDANETAALVAAADSAIGVLLGRAQEKRTH